MLRSVCTEKNNIKNMTVNDISKEETPQHNNISRSTQDVPELVSAGPDEKNWRGIGIALLVIVCVCALIVTAVVLLTPGDRGSTIGKSRVSLDDVVNGIFSYSLFNGTWISDHEFLYLDSHQALEIYDLQNNSRNVIMSNNTFRQYNVVAYTMSADRKFILLSHKYQRTYRYSYKAAFLLYNVHTEQLTNLFPDSPDLMLQYAAWGPTNSQLVYVLDNNIFYMTTPETKPRQLTNSGSKNVIYNGIPDWVYEEEILSSNHALWWSDDGTKLCFATFNDTNVDEMNYSYYGSYKEPKSSYPEMISLRYPKAGKTNPTVTLFVSNLISEGSPQPVSPPKEYQEIEYYFTEAQWMDNKSLSITWLKRAQNSSIISICRENDRWQCEKNFQLDIHGGWVQSSPVVFSDDKTKYFTILPGPADRNIGTFQHIAMIDIKNGSKTYLTSGRYDVADIVNYNADEKALYYKSSLEDKPSDRQLFKVTELSSNNPTSVCLTCGKSEDCVSYGTQFSTGGSYYTLNCHGPGIPKSELKSTTNSAYDYVIETNGNLRKLVDKFAMPRVKRLRVPISSDYHADVKLLLPPGLREDEITKYPMLLEVYAGPGSQMVKEKFGVNWGYYLASKRNIIYAVIDGRGSSFKGNKMLYELYRKLGTVEVVDQIAVTSYLRDNFAFIDESKIAVFGWSYGGFVTASILATDKNEVFRCGISVAPVTNWLYYDSVYTERYMQSPSSEDNLVNYQKTDLMRRADQFKGKKFLLIHGTADDNVHWQQSALLSKALADAGVIFRMQVYPDEQHALSSVKLHLYQTIDEFLTHCYSGNEVGNSDVHD